MSRWPAHQWRLRRIEAEAYRLIWNCHRRRKLQSMPVVFIENESLKLLAMRPVETWRLSARSCQYKYWKPIMVKTEKIMAIKIIWQYRWSEGMKLCITVLCQWNSMKAWRNHCSYRQRHGLASSGLSCDILSSVAALAKRNGLYQMQQNRQSVMA